MHSSPQIRPLICQVGAGTYGVVQWMGDSKCGPAVPWAMKGDGQPEAGS